MAQESDARHLMPIGIVFMVLSGLALKSPVLFFGSIFWAFAWFMGWTDILLDWLLTTAVAEQALALRDRYFGWIWTEEPLPEPEPEPLPARIQHAPAASLPVRPAPAPAQTIIDRLLKVDHLLVIGQTGGGKTVLIHHLAQQWLRQGGFIVVLDPKYRQGVWRGCQRIVGIHDDRIIQTIEDLDIEYNLRLDWFGRNVDFDRIQRLTFIIDEYHTVAQVAPGVRDLMEKVLRLGRELKMRLVIGVQDSQVGTMGLEGASQLKTNFSYVVRCGFNQEGQRTIELRSGDEKRVIDKTLAPRLPDLKRLVKVVDPDTLGIGSLEERLGNGSRQIEERPQERNGNGERGTAFLTENTPVVVWGTSQGNGERSPFPNRADYDDDADYVNALRRARGDSEADVTFALRLLRHDVPVRLICSAVGGNRESTHTLVKQLADGL